MPPIARTYLRAPAATVRKSPVWADVVVDEGHEVAGCRIDADVSLNGRAAAVTDVSDTERQIAVQTPYLCFRIDVVRLCTVNHDELRRMQRLKA